MYDLEADRFMTFLARGPGEEGRIFREFADYVGAPRRARLYHWTSFEIGRIDDAIARTPKLARRLQALKRSCVDLKQAVHKKVFFATNTYSIKEVAPSIGFEWRQDDVDAFESMVLYWEFLESGDPRKAAPILMYNEDDCMAMVCVDRWLCTHAGVPGPFRRG